MMAFWMLAAGILIQAPDKPAASLRSALSFHASFDRGPDADFAKGDKRLYTAAGTNRKAAKAGIHRPDVAVVAGAGRHGAALAFRKKQGPFVFFRGEQNIPYAAANWNGTVSFWLSLDPDKDLDPGYCDPIQVTQKDWNDATIFVEFTKDHKPRRFRLAVCADLKEWNPMNREWESIPAAERPMVEVVRPPFAHGKWTHIAITFANFNTREHAEAVLYLNGNPVGKVAGRPQKFTWTPADSAILLGLSYIGLMDELALFDRALTPAEIETLYTLPGGVADVYRD
jgi:hypothetical protein